MSRIVVIDADRARAQALALDCARQGVAVRLAETVSEGLRHLGQERVSAVLVDAGLIRLTAAEQARLFQSAAPGIAMVTLAAEATGEEDRLRFDLEGFHVVERPVDVREMLAKIEPRTLVGRRPRGAAAARGL
jgi:DNA-binding response OmpR family regulator